MTIAMAKNAANQRGTRQRAIVSTRGDSAYASRPAKMKGAKTGAKLNSNQPTAASAAKTISTWLSLG